MTAVHFEEWFHDSLLPNLQSNSLIVMDNAPYRSRKLEPVPTMSSTKQQMQDWLTAMGIVFPECSLKRELLQLIVASSPTSKYAVDEMTKAAGHEIARLPPYHCELNPTELAWSQVKRYNKENKLFTLTAIKELTFKGFEQLGAEDWKKLIEHVRKKFEDKYWAEDGLQVGVDKLCFYFGPLCFIFMLEILTCYAFVCTHYTFFHNDYAFLQTIIS